MSYTLAFWSGGDDLDPRDTYLRLESEDIPEVREIDRAELDAAKEFAAVATGFGVAPAALDG